MSDAFDYSAARDDADELLAEFGATVYIRRTAATGGSAWEPTQTTTDYPTIGVVLNITRWRDAFFTGTDTLTTDRYGLAAAGPLTALGIEPTAADSFVATTGQIFRIIATKPLKPVGLSLLHAFLLRG